MEIIAHIHNGFSTKFGVPRQSGLVQEVESRIVFTPEYRVAEALRGIEGFSHLWVLWQFHQAKQEKWSPTVRPPRLGGNTRMGVFATRSPFRPNSIGLSCVRLLRVEKDEKLGHVLVVSGADMMDGTPVVDIKPYLPFADSHPEAVGGFAQEHTRDNLTVDFPVTLREKLPEETARALTGILSQDPRPHYHEDPDRVYGFPYEGMEVRFTVDENRVLHVIGIDK